MIFTRLPDTDPENPHPQCAAEIWVPLNSYSVPRADRHWTRRRTEILGFDPDKCQQRSSISVDGVLYCGKHAAMLALKEVLGE